MNHTRSAGGAVTLADFDQTTANLFDPDLRLEPDLRDIPQGCSAQCTNDGCTAASTC